MRSETSFLVVRISQNGDTDLFATGRYLDRYRIEDDGVKLNERVVVCDSSRIDTLLAPAAVNRSDAHLPEALARR